MTLFCMKAYTAVFTAGTSSAFTDTTCKPSIMPYDDLRHLLLGVASLIQQCLIWFDYVHTCICLLTCLLCMCQTANGFLLIVRCDRAKILFVSESVSKILNFSKVSFTSVTTNIRKQGKVAELLFCFEWEEYTTDKTSRYMRKATGNIRKTM